EFWNGKRVLRTGHTGFKGTWMALWLETMGAQVTGFGLAPETQPSLFEAVGAWRSLRSVMGDIRDPGSIQKAVAESDPEIVIHMAAQALVRRSYREPVDTVSTNVLGTVNLLEALRDAKALQVCLTITSDKVYRNSEQGVPFREDDPLGGDDPYSASKAAQEIVAQSWAKSFFGDGPMLATARAGNVIGGGDFSEDRLIPDLYRSIAAGERMTLRNPHATRPWQHVMDLNAGYLMFIEALSAPNTTMPHALNFGPLPGPSYTVGAITEKMMQALGVATPARVEPSDLYEKTLLSIDASVSHDVLGWRPKLDVDDTVRLTADWYGAFLQGADARDLTLGQLKEFDAVTEVGG
ncbi:MAG: CDP-glucose 4,6-dehydratase, partial [Alphaproteobacteria bacterium]|nr:CDP-glucose 4,6-dehydratase [Alphaproteobacteria bacterium]